ncbi:MAG: hypothetical protein ACRCUE_04400 [Bosea sp. (in: a-proteobacteria)]
MQKPLKPLLDEDERQHRRKAMIVRLTVIALVGGAGLWLVFEMDKSRRAQECLESGRRNCRIIDQR